MTTAVLEMDVKRSDLKCLETGHGLSLRNAAGVALTPLNGRVWLTMEGDRRDLDLRPGRQYVIERDGVTIAYALEPSLVRVEHPRARRGFWRELGTQLWAYLARVGEARARARMARGLRLL